MLDKNKDGSAQRHRGQHKIFRHGIAPTPRAPGSYALLRRACHNKKEPFFVYFG